jgi:stage III sporulation protein AD
MTLLIKIIGIGLVTVAAFLLLKPHRPDVALIISLSGGGICLLEILSVAESFFSSLSGLFVDVGLSPYYFSVALKAVGIGYATSFAADAAADSGQTLLANQINMAGKTVILILALPVVKELLELALRLVE